jgi:hypothetical protein
MVRLLKQFFVWEIGNNVRVFLLEKLPPWDEELEVGLDVEDIEFFW